jgi:hypothetical protein
VALLVLAGLANVVVLIGQAHGVLVWLYSNADNDAGFVLPKFAGSAAGSQINLGYHTFYEWWIFARVTVGLPGARQLWELWPFVVSFAGFAVVAGCALATLGRWAALLTTVVLLSSGSALWLVIFTPESHLGAGLHAGLCCAALLLVHRAATRRARWPAVLLLGVLIVALSVLGMTDPLIATGVLAPYIAAPLLCWWVAPSRALGLTAAFAVVTGALILIGGSLIAHSLQSSGVVATPFPIDFVPASQLIGNLENALAALTGLGNGAFFGLSASGSGIYTAVAGGLCLLALAAELFGLSVGAGRTALSARPAAAAAGAAGPAGLRDRVRLFSCFWGLALVITLGEFTLTTLGDAATGRYLIVGWTAAAALVGVLARSGRARELTVVGVLAFAVLAARGSIQAGTPAPFGGAPSYSEVAAIEKFARAHGAQVGFASYWQASPITYETDYRLRVYPIEACPTSPPFCMWNLAYIGEWYDVGHLHRTFLVTSPTTEPTDMISAPAGNLGAPLAATTVGQYTVDVYPYDIRSAFGTW